MINGILFRQRTGIPWRDSPARFGKWKTVHDRHRRWPADGTWDRGLQGVQADADADADAEGRTDWSMVGVDSTSCRAHQHAAGARTDAARMPGRRGRPVQHHSGEALGRSRGGLTCTIHLAGEGGRRPLAFVITPGQWGDAPQLIPVPERIGARARPAVIRARAPIIREPAMPCSSRRNRRYPRRRQIKHTIPERKDQRANHKRRGSAGGRPVGFGKTICKRRNEVERTINALKGFRAVATRFDKRAYAFHGTATVVAIRPRLRS